MARVGDRAYDSNALLVHIAKAGARAVIPSRSNRTAARDIDRVSYGNRNVIERWFGRLKSFRRLATRYDKTLLSYAGFVATGAVLLALCGWRA